MMPSLDAERRWMLGFVGVLVFWDFSSNIVFLASTPVVFWSLHAFVITTGLAALLVAARTGVLSPRQYFATMPATFLALLKGTVIALCVFSILTFIVRDLVQSVVPPLDFLHVREPGQIHLVASVPLVLLAIDLAIGALIEEIVYRGMLFKIIGNSALYTGVSTLLFAGTHSGQGPLGVVNAALFSVAACMLFLRWRTVVPLALAHLGINLTVLATSSA